MKIGIGIGSGSGRGAAMLCDLGVGAGLCYIGAENSGDIGIVMEEGGMEGVK